jgi:DMSO/TMAO reductase YedYZ molybdopterin-dependent catalytic subunit
MHYALDDSNDVLVAYKQNHRWLTPDHGFPVRMIIPGFIGGRMVKWLQEISVTEGESDNFYHFHDNRVMPPHVDEELAKKEGECCCCCCWMDAAAAAAAAAAAGIAAQQLCCCCIECAANWRTSTYNAATAVADHLSGPG